MMGWIKHRGWAPEEELCYFRLVQQMSVWQRQRKLCKDIQLIEMDALKRPDPVAGLDYSLELKPAYSETPAKSDNQDSDMATTSANQNKGTGVSESSGSRTTVSSAGKRLAEEMKKEKEEVKDLFGDPEPTRSGTKSGAEKGSVEKHTGRISLTLKPKAKFQAKGPKVFGRSVFEVTKE